MELTLKVMTGRNAGQEVRVPVSKFIIGRSEDCHLRPHSDLVSRHHCAILVDEGAVTIRDFNSKNGTFVNGEKVVGQRSLKTGDKLSVGQLVFEVQAAHGSPVSRRPKVKSIADAAARTANAENREDDTDVTAWLSEETSISSAHDTQGNDMTQTAYLSAEQLLETATTAGYAKSDAVSESKAGLKTSDSKAGKKVPPGRLPPVPTTPQSKDSREAASEMLKKILRNR